MQVTFDIPDELASQLVAAGKDPSRTALEAFAIEGYRSERLTESEVRQTLGFKTRMEVHAFLKQHEAYLHYTLDDLDRDIESSRLLGLKQAPAPESVGHLAG